MAKSKLTKGQVLEALALYSAGKTRTEIADLYNVDRTTIGIYIRKNKLDTIIPPDNFSDDIYEVELARLREKQHKCKHTSWKCSCCGLYKDNVISEEYQTIAKQKEYIKHLQNLLKLNNISYVNFFGFENKYRV